jgi:hypothetical protein
MATVFRFVRLTPFTPLFSFESPSSCRARRDADICRPLHARARSRFRSSGTRAVALRPGGSDPLGATSPCLVREHGEPLSYSFGPGSSDGVRAAAPSLPLAATDLHPSAPAGESTLPPPVPAPVASADERDTNWDAFADNLFTEIQVLR